MVFAYQTIEPGQGHEAGLALLEQLYRQLRDAPMPPIARTALGKPYFPESTLHFSISHTKRHVFCVLSERPVGIDAEEADRQIRLEMADKLLSASERQRFLASAEPRQALLRLWVLKEAAAKCSGQGLQLWPNHTDFSPEDPRIREVGGCIVAVIEE